MATAFKISEAAALALHAVVMLTQHRETSLTTRTIADALSCSAAHLSKVMQRLVRAGFITSERGPHGGFMLAREPRDIRLLEVLEAIEGPFECGGCLLNPQMCVGGECAFGALSIKVNKVVRDELTRLTAEDLLTRKLIPLPQLAY